MLDERKLDKDNGLGFWASSCYKGNMIIAQHELVAATNDEQRQSLALLLCKKKELVIEDIERVNQEGKNCFLQAAARGENNANLSLMIRAKCDIHGVQNGDVGYSAVILAALNGNHETVMNLYDLGADINAKSKQNFNAFLVSAWNGQTDVLKTLAQIKADFQCSNDDGLTPIMLAAQIGRADTIEFLIRQNADVNQSNAVYR
jgi:ankyrin repeat protein